MKHDPVHRHTKDRQTDPCDVRGVNSFSDAWSLFDLYAEPVCADVPAENGSEVLKSEKDILRWCVTVLSASPVARAMLKEAMEENWLLELADLENHDFHLDVPDKKITLDSNGLLQSALANSSYFRNALLVSLIRALRDVWQEKRHGGFDENYAPESILMLERVRAADCDTICIFVGWELRSEGHGNLWRHMIGSEEGDMAMAFQNHLERDPSALFTGKAMIACFDQWFRNADRSNACDHETLEYLDHVMQSNAGDSPFGTKTLTRTDIEILSCLPDKTAYLRGCGENIMRDPLYAGLHDAINQNHLMHILYDLEATHVQGVPFRDADLATRIFPEGTEQNAALSFHETK